MRILVYIFSMICVFNVFAHAQSTCLDQTPLDGQQMKRWAKDYVGWIITSEESSAFKKLSSFTDKTDFIKNFWLRRDPNPETDENEFLIEYCARFAYTSKFTSAIPGFMTDRGRVYILWGSPDRVETDKGSFEGSHDVVFERWHYNYISNLGSNFSITFIDPTESKEFRLTNQESKALSPVFECYNRKLLPTPWRQKEEGCFGQP